MAYDRHIALGWDYSDHDKVKQVFGVEFDLNVDDELRNGSRSVAQVQQAIEDAWRMVLSEMAADYGWQYISDETEWSNTALSYLTAAGLREFHEPMLQIFLDRDECEQETEDALIGIDLTGRYYPRLLDWQYENGGGMVPLKPANLQWLERFKGLLTAQFPGFQDSYIVIPEVFY
jgi:hypothetical protein